MAQNTRKSGCRPDLDYRILEGGGPNDGDSDGIQEVFRRRIDHFFKVSERGSTVMTEVRGGLAGWMTTSYILVVNPTILHVASGQSGVGIAPLVTATALSSAIGSLLVGLCANVPFALVPGMGLNAYFSYGICQAMGMSYEEALSSTLMSGVMLLILWLAGISDFIVRAVMSDHLKMAVTAAIGMFQAMIGFQAMGVVVRSSDTLVTMGDLGLYPENAHLYLALSGLLLIAGMLVGLRLRGSMLIGILVLSGLSWASGLDPPPSAVFQAPSWTSMLRANFAGWIPGNPMLVRSVMAALVQLFVCLFDLAGVCHGLQTAAGIPFTDRKAGRATPIAAISTICGALMGSSPVIVATESSAAIMEGSRTGLSAVVMSVLFALSAVVAPVVCAVPRSVTAVPLVVVGAFMMAPCSAIAWDDLRVAFPSFLTMTLVPFTYSIHNGIIAGLIFDVFLWSLEKASPRPVKDDVISDIQSLHTPCRQYSHDVKKELDECVAAMDREEKLRSLVEQLLQERAAFMSDTIVHGQGIPPLIKNGTNIEAVAAELGIETWSDKVLTPNRGTMICTSACTTGTPPCHTTSSESQSSTS